MPRPSAPALALLLLASACGDDKVAITSASTDTTAASTSAASTTDASGTTGEPTTDDAPTTTAATTTDASTGVASTGDAASTGASTGGEVLCAALPPGPLTAELLWTGYTGSEDLAFDGAGGLALKKDGQLVLVSSDQQEAVLAAGLPQVYGTRVALDGTILLALPQQGKLQGVDADNNVLDLVTGLDSPNGVYVDPAGDVWLTDFGGARVVRYTPDWAPVEIVSGPDAATANGIVFDPLRGLLFFTNYAAGRLLRMPIVDGAPSGPPEPVGEIMGAKLDGLALDGCGNAYAVDQGNSRLYRFFLDGDGVALADPELLAEFPDNVANAQFGRGPGFDADTLYLSGNPGSVYRVVVGVEGAPIGLP